MAESLHPNVALITRLDTKNLGADSTLFADDFVWRYFNPKLPELHGAHRGVEGLAAFFKVLSERTRGSFHINPISVTAFGDELVVTHVQNSLTWEGESVMIDAIVVWRVVEGRLAEAWDIPSLYSLATPQ